jgi:hypothetical protein
MKQNMMKKSIVSVISVLFIGIATSPGIYATSSDISMNEHVVEAVIEIVGVTESVERTVTLSPTTMEELDELFETMRTDLDHSETREDALELFTAAVGNLETYGFLEKIPLEQAKEVMFRKMGILPFNISGFCRIVGKATNTHFDRFSNIYLESLRYMDIPPLPLPLFLIVVLCLGVIAASTIPWIMCSLFDIELREFISFGYLEPSGYGFRPVPSRGWIRTRGLLGEKNITGEIYGMLPFFPVYIGALGFTGVKIAIEGGYTYFLGSASLVMV